MFVRGPPMQLLRDNRDRAAAPSAPQGATTLEPRDETRAARRYLCRACDGHVADVGDEVAVDGLTVHERVNPGAFVHRFVTLARAREVQTVTAATSEFTWFAGYAWAIVRCTGCGAHLGWRFESAAGARSPAVFYGVRLDQIR